MEQELLAPAGSYESMKAAVAAGADAVYIGGNRFGARAFADNLDQEQMCSAIDYLHLHQKKLYLTINTLLKEQELDTLYDYLYPYYLQGLDAVIVQDIGVIRYLRAQFPDLTIHASTQMTANGIGMFREMEALGVERVVTSREMSLQEIRSIHRKSPLEIESFVHGALCYCYSGQCLLSSLIGGRSGNRGRCAQPCRLPYMFEQKGKSYKGYLLSTKDICTLSILPDIADAGVYSFKIEGRMKRPEYTAGVVRIYRKYLDLYQKYGKERYQVDENDLRDLMDLYNRGGFSQGYYTQHNGSNMMFTKKPSHYGTKAVSVQKQVKNQITVQALEPLHPGDHIEIEMLSEQIVKQEIKAGETYTLSACGRKVTPGMIGYRMKNEALLLELSAYSKTETKEKIKGVLTITQKNPAMLKLIFKNQEVSIQGDIPQPAANHPMTEESLQKQMRKTGGTAFVFDEMKITLEDGLYLSLPSLNQLRRTAMEQLTAKILACSRRKERLPIFLEEQSLPKGFEEQETVEITCSCDRFEQLMALQEQRDLARVYIEMALLLEDPQKLAQLMEKLRKQQTEIFLAMPHIFRDQYEQKIAKTSVDPLWKQFDGFLIRNIESWEFLKRRQEKRKVIADYHLYTWNRSARSYWNEQGVWEDTIPLECNSREIRQRGVQGSEMVVYGHMPVMISAQCLKKTTGNCDHKPGVNTLVDRKKKQMLVRNHCEFCYNIIYNESSLYLADCLEEITGFGVRKLRLQFIDESPKEVQAILKTFQDVLRTGEKPVLPEGSFTRGHFRRGVE